MCPAPGTDLAHWLPPGSCLGPGSPQFLDVASYPQCPLLPARVAQRLDQAAATNPHAAASVEAAWLSQPCSSCSVSLTPQDGSPEDQVLTARLSNLEVTCDLNENNFSRVVYKIVSLEGFKRK